MVWLKLPHPANQCCPLTLNHKRSKDKLVWIGSITPLRTTSLCCFGQLADSRTTCCHFAVTWHTCQMHWYELIWAKWQTSVLFWHTFFELAHVLHTTHVLPVFTVYLQRDFTYYTEPLFRRGKMAAITTSLHTGKYQLFHAYFVVQISISTQCLQARACQS